MSVYYDKTQPEADWANHSHPAVQILFFGTGAECTIHWKENGKWLNEEVTGQHLWIIGAGVAHKLEWRREALRLVFYVEPGFVRESAGLEIVGTALFTLDGVSRCDAQIPVLLGEFEGLDQPMTRPELVHVESLSAFVAVHILRAWNCLTTNLPDWRSRMCSGDLARVEHMIKCRLGEKILISEMAREVNMSVSNFARIFTRSIGTTPGQYLISLRIEKAKELLLSTDYRIGEIALLVGFSSQAHFDVFFKRRVDLTPSEYRLFQRR